MDLAQKQGSVCRVYRTANTRKVGPAKLSERRSGLDPEVVNRSRPESGHSSHTGLPLTAGAHPASTRYQVSGRSQ